MARVKYRVEVDGKDHEVTLLSKTGSSVSFLLNDKLCEVNVSSILNEALHFNLENIAQSLPVHNARQAPASKSNEVRAPMPGIIVSVSAKPGDAVNPGDVLLVMEAMKMENNITAPKGGKVKDVLVKAGQEVNNAQVLVVFE